MASVGRVMQSYHPTTLGLSDQVIDAVTEIVYSCRDGVTTLCLVFEDKEVFRSVVGTIPPEIENAETYRYAVDYESLGTDLQRLYIDSTVDNHSIIGYNYNSSFELIQSKNYKRNGDDGLLVDRYDSGGSLVSPDEGEVPCQKSEWTGDQNLPNYLEADAKAHGFTVIYLKKTTKNQTYIRVAGD